MDFKFFCDYVISCLLFFFDSLKWRSKTYNQKRQLGQKLHQKMFAFHCHYLGVRTLTPRKSNNFSVTLQKGLMIFLGQNYTKSATVIWWIFGDGLACCPIERILVWRELYLGPDIFKVLAARNSTLKYSTLKNTSYKLSAMKIVNFPALT